ncbi:MAG: prolyl oligopeptidase family serine peptidase [Acidobacteriota bacterium]
MNRSTLLILASALLQAFPLFSQARAPVDGTIFSTAPVTLKKFADVPLLERYTTPVEYAADVTDRSYVYETVTYFSDGLKVKALLYRPRNAARRLPVIVFNRGGYLAVETPEMWLSMFHRLAEAGFVILAPMLRESVGGEGLDKAGGDDVHDVLNAIEVATKLPYSDSGNIFMYGHSRGGMMTYQAVRDGAPIRAAATVGAFTDFRALIESRPEEYDPLIAKLFPDYAQRRDEIQLRRSALLFADQLNVPLLIMAGTNDNEVIPAKAIDLAVLLLQKKKTVELHVFSKGFHTLRDRAGERDRLVTEWFKKTMNSEAPPTTAR